MANITDVSLEGEIEWTNSPVHLKQFADKYGVPNFVKVVKGQYRDIGVAKSVNSEHYLHSIQVSQKVLAEAVKVKEGKKVIVTNNQKYSLPLTYQGWFELLSQDGKAVKPITTVAELARSFPASCIMRETYKAFVPRENGEMSVDKTRGLQAGEHLNLVGEVWVTMNTSKGGMIKRRMLHCLDVKGESVYMAMEQKGMFSPIAGQTNISGVHSLKGLLEKFRMPILVRLVHGIIPSKLEKHFSGVFRLNSVYSDESAFICPLKKDSKMIPISTREPLKLVASHNFESLIETEAGQYHMERCDRMIASYLNSIHVLFSLPDPEIMINSKQNSVPETKKHSDDDVEEDILFDEVEDIYAYVREGGPVPPPPRPRPLSQNAQGSQAVQVVQPLPGPKIKPSKSEKRQSAKRSSRTSSSPQPDVEEPNLVSISRSPHPSPRAVFIPNKDDYWEEPIYEPLDKIRQKKGKEKKVEERIPAPVVLDPIPQRRSPSPDTFDHHHPYREPTSPSSPVQNLRQMYKMNSFDPPSGYPPSQPSLDHDDDDIEELHDILQDMTAPPVPPKNFGDFENNSTNSSANGSEIQKQLDQMPILRSLSREDNTAMQNDRLEFESESVISEEQIGTPAFVSPPPLPRINLSKPKVNSSKVSPPQITKVNKSPVLKAIVPPTISPLKQAEPSITVHTPQVARAIVPGHNPAYPTSPPATLAQQSPYAPTSPTSTTIPSSPTAYQMSNGSNISNSQPTLVLASSNMPSSGLSMSQSHEMLNSSGSGATAAAANGSGGGTYMYTTVPPADYNLDYNNHHINGQHPHTPTAATASATVPQQPQKVVLNLPKEPYEKQVLNRRLSNGHPVTAVKVSPTKTAALNSTADVLYHGNNRASVAGTGGAGVYSTGGAVHAPYVAVARVGDAGASNNTGHHYDARQFHRTDNARRKVQSMYL